MAESEKHTTGSIHKTSYVTKLGVGLVIFLIALLLVSLWISYQQEQRRIKQDVQFVTAVDGVRLVVTWPAHLLIGESGTMFVDVIAEPGWQRPFTITAQLPPSITSVGLGREKKWEVLSSNGRYQQFNLPIHNVALLPLSNTQTITLNTTLNHVFTPLVVSVESTRAATMRQFLTNLIRENGSLLLVITTIIGIAALIFQEQERSVSLQMRQNEFRFKEIELAEKQAEREEQHLQEQTQQRQQQAEQESRQRRQEMKSQADKMRICLANADKISLQRIWAETSSPLFQEIVTEIENGDWLIPLVKFALGHTSSLSVNSYKEIAQVWADEVGGAYLCASKDDKKLYDVIPLEKIENLTLRNKLIRTQLNRLPLQDWLPHFPLPADAIAPSPIETTKLVQILKNDPFLHRRAEDELTTLFEMGAFWIHHPLYHQIAIATQRQLVSGVSGCGRTALARALCYYEPQVRRHFWAYVPLATASSPINVLHRSLAEQWLDYILDKPTLLFRLTENNRKLLAITLKQALSSTYVLAKLEHGLSNGDWYQQAESEEQKRNWKLVGEIQIELLMQAIRNYESLNELFLASHWVFLVKLLGFQGLRLVLDVANNDVPEYFRTDLGIWHETGVILTVFIAESQLSVWREHHPEISNIKLNWEASQLSQMFQHRFNRLPRKLPELVWSEGALDLFLRNVKTPREMSELWSLIITMVDRSDDIQILSEDVNRAVGRLHQNLNSAVQTGTSVNVDHLLDQLNAQQKHELTIKIAKTFDLEDIKELCLGLGVEYEELKGENIRSAKARELVNHMEYRGRLKELIASLSQARSQVNWLLLP